MSETKVVLIPVKVALRDAVMAPAAITSEGFGRGIMGVVLLWSLFESDFNELLEALDEANGSVLPQSWKTQPYKKRRGYLRDLVVKPFAACPAVCEFFCQIADLSVPLFQRRNLICHGSVEFYLGTTPALVATGIINGRSVTESFTSDALASLVENLGQLAGLFHLLDRSVTRVFPHAASHETLTLQAFLASHYWTRSKFHNA
jgi:hypothetical protein